MDSSGAGNAGLNYYDDGDVIIAKGGGNVGIGQNNPGEKLHVNGIVYSSSGGLKFPDSTIQTTAAGPGAAHWGTMGASIIATNSGNVGIGIGGVPTEKLNVGGTVLVQGAGARVITPVLEITGGSDLSEQFEIRADDSGALPSPGMVVSIDPENVASLVVSNQAYDRRVAGVISGAGDVNCGVLMGQKGSQADGANPVALTGRVYCRADASRTPIELGDLLTTSPTPGHAMAVTDYPKAQGAILGKAMSPLKQGRGLVLVLVSLQ
jgi:hypothetical protein